ncbi:MULTISPECIES: restriction endonuclease subunit S [unclassified Empedobacter]|uniref:restriction endonuclease subunit S n=1 Tax=unclassified Empedobacter TaxID=2643773 RepID=UPI0025BB369E|nr:MULTISPECIES: restriction endonuclease subunit S [unclassified Empedobacter]
MENLQPKLRFPEFRDVLKVDVIENICKVDTGNKDTQNKVENGEYPFFVRSNNVEKINSFSYDGEAVLTSGDGVGVGKNYHYINGKFDYHQRVYCMKDFKNVNARYFYYQFSNKFYNRVMRMTAKNSVDSVRREMITKMDFFIPSIQEQTKIADFLGAVDKQLDVLNQKKEKLNLYKKGVMQQLFAQQLRFKNDNGNDFPDWQEKMLGEVAIKKSSNLTVSNVDDLKGEYILYGASGIIDKINFYQEENEYISIIKDGSGVGRTFLCKKFSSVLGTLDKIVAKDNIHIYFLYSVLNNIKFEKYITGSTIPHIYYKDYSKEKIQVPSLEEQTKIANFLIAIDNQILALENQITKTETYKKGLLQQMFV